MKTSTDRLLMTRHTQGVFLSDLHLFSQRSIGEYKLENVLERIPTHGLMVLGGDIFDFKWSRLRSFEQTLQAALHWLKELALHWNGDVLFLPGNHDCTPKFIERLEELSANVGNLHWRPHHAQLGDALFLHGDVLDSTGGLAQLHNYRQRFHHETPQSKLANGIYDVAVAMRIHRTIPKMRHVPIKTCQRLSGWLPHLEDRQAPVRRVFFGHTHVPIHGLSVNGIHFYNPGPR